MNILFLKSISFFALVCISSIVTAQTERATVGRSFGGIKVIRINTTGGTIELSRSNSRVVQVTVTFNLDKKIYQPIFEQTDSILFLKEELIFKPSATSESIWKVSVPDGLEAQYSSSAGDLNVTDLKIAISANSVSGNYTWKNVSGNSTITSPAGDIRIENYQGTIGIKGRSGNVIISKCVGNLDINTGPGDVTLTEATGSIFVTTGSGSIQAQNVSLKEKSSFNTQSGAAELWLAAPVDKELAISTTSGPAIIHCKGMKLEGQLIITASKNSKIKSPYTLSKPEEIKDANGALRVQNKLQLGSSSNVINIRTESGVIVVKK